MIDLLNQLQQKNIQLSSDSGTLKVKAPKGAMTAELAEQIKTHKEQLLHFLERKQQGRSVASIPLCAIDRSGAIPASFSQQRLWLIDKLEGSQHYNVAAALACDGVLDIAAIEASLTQIVARHEALRTCFEAHDGVCMQRVMPARAVTVEVVNLVDCGEDEVQRQVDDAAREVFDLSQDLMLRTKIIKQSQTRHILLFTLHHIASDGWSMQLLIKEFNAFYQAAITGGEADVPELPVQYGDYAYWQQQQLTEQNKAQLLRYWQARLSGMPSLHGLPLDKPRPAKQEFTSGYVRSRIGKETLAGLQALTQSAGVTLFMVLQGAFAVLLSRLSGESDIVLGVPTAGRSESELSPLIGFFINTLVSRTEVDLAQPFTALLAQIKADTLADYQHQGLPFELLVEALNPDRSLAYNPLCQVKLVLQNHRSSDDEGLSLGEARLKPLQQSQEQVRFDLDLTCSEGEGELLCHWRYQQSLFTEATIAAYARSFEYLLESIAKGAQGSCKSLALYDDEMRQSLIEESVGAACDYRRGESVVEQFARQAQQTPERIAVRDDSHALSYEELYSRVNQLAHYLQEQDIGVGERVALVMTRDVTLLVAMLGVMATGASYIPLSPDNQTARLADIFNDADVTQVLVSTCLLEILPVSGVDVLMLDEDEWGLSGYDSHPVGVTHTLADSAYVIYTSGSTGKPKGVEVSHRGLIDYCGYGLKAYYQEQLTGSYVLTSHAFDIGVPSLYLPLLVGGCVNLAPWGEELEGLVERLRGSSEASLYRLTPMHCEALLELLDGDKVSGAHVLVIGGETLTEGLAARLQDTFSESQLYNHYGPTETVVGCSLYDASAHLRAGDSTREEIPIGYAMANTGLYVVDVGGELQAKGGVGELYVGGPCVAKGYVGDPDRTAASFVYVPWLADTRLYRTGDRVRRLESGALVFLGRKDEQVKLRGYRIELGEIRSVLAQQAVVKQAAVLVQGEGADATLVGYVVAEGEVVDEGIFIAELERALSARLASYMCPSRWCLLDALPLTANGKLDRGALPSEIGEIGQEYEAAENSVERALVEIWAEVLRQPLEELSVTGDFFRLGGNSLLAVKIISEINARYKLQLGLKELFSYPSIRRLSVLMQQSGLGENNPEIPALPRDGQALPLSYAQQRLWFIEQLATQPNAQFNMPLALRIRGQLETNTLEQAIAAVIKRHEILRTVYQLDQDGEPQQVILPAFAPRITTLELNGSEQEKLNQAHANVAAQALQPFNLQSDHMLKVQLLQLGKHDYVLAIVVHHIACDGWSLNILLNDIMAFYDAISSAQAPTLEPLTIQYADFASWQRRYLGGERLQHGLDFWLSHLDQAPPLHSIPLDRNRAPDQFSGARLDGTIAPDIVNELELFAQQHQSTLFMLLQTMFAVTVGRFSREQDVVMGMPAVNRNNKSCQNMIGLFLNTLVVRTQFDTQQPIGELLRKAKQTHMEIHAHSEVPFELLVEQLNPERSLTHAPIFQLFINMANEQLALSTESQLEVSAFSAQQEFDSKYDITLYLRPTHSGLKFIFAYNAALFDCSTITALANEFSSTLYQVAANPQLNVAQLKWSQPLKENAAVTLCEHEVSSVHQLFELNLSKHAASGALHYAEQKLSFEELNEQSNKLAHYLIKQHAISKGQTVGIHCQRNATRIITMLAVLKAGATLVPLSVELPASRLRLQAEDADITLLLHDEQTEASFFERATLDCSSLLRESTLDQYSGENPDVEVFSDDIAHIIYTSGSTGKPKGVLGTHGAVVNRVSWMLQRFPLASNEVTVMMTSMAFIRGMWEFYVSLAAIKPVVLLPREQVKDNNLFVAAIEKHKITRIVTTPSHLQSLVISGAQYRSTLSSLRYWFISGEALSLSLAERCCKWLDEVEFYNLYGSTEVMSDVLYSNIKEDVARGVITLGQAITNNHVLLVDEQLQRVPTGAVGEVLVVGSNVAAGYLLRPEQTKAAFVEYDGQRAYRTGDLAKYLADGRLVGLGRKDKQVKIRGFRVEVDEIASLLRNRSEVDDAIVLVKGTELQQRLIAYLNVGCRAVKPSQLEQIKVYLSDQLPDYMVPSHFVTVENWPLTINGKLQYSALPEPTYQNDQMQVVPSTETEHQLLEIWQGLLNVTTIGVTDSFFALGGHSLLATRLVSQVEATFGLTIALKAVFENSTIQLLAQHIDNHGKASLGAITPAPKGKQIPLSYAQQRLWFVEQVSPSNQYNMPLAYQVTGKFALQVAEQALQYLVNRHAVLRTQYQFDGQTAYQEVQENWQVRLTVSDLTHLSEQQQKDSIIDLLRSFYQRVFVLEEQPPFEIHYICRSSEQGILLFNLHHIAADAWSMGILMSEFIHCYQAIEAGVDPQLPALSIQYSDFAYWQRQRLDDVFLAEQLAYWRTQLQDVPSIHNLPLDRPRPSVRAQQGAIYESCLSGEIVQQLEKVASQHNVSMYMLFHAALAFLVSKLSGQQDVVIGCPIANRTNVEVEPLIGLFVNTLVLRTQVQQESFNGLLEHIRTVNLDAQAHQDVPFEQLVDLCKLLRTSSHTPLVQVVLNLNNIGQSVAGIEGLEFTPLEQQSTIAKTDLNLGVVFAGGKWVINWTYDVALFDADTIERFSSYFIRILHQVAHNPRIALSDIDLLNEQTQQALVAMSRGPELALTRIQQVHQFLENQVTRTPEAIALVSDTQSYNYQELNSAVNKLSNYLLKLELPRQATVGICMERCSDMVIAMYAVAKAGLVFTPLDPEQPQARRAFIISNAKVHLVLSHQQFEPILRQIPALAVAYIDSVATNQLITQCSNINPEIGGHNTDLAYIMYTSGSSGEPKGVQIEHRQIIAATQSRLDAYRVPAGRFLSLSSIYFDSCLLGIFSVLAQGAELHIVKDSDVVDIGAVYRYIMASDITHLAILPTMYRALLQYANLMAALPSQLRLVITGGEGVEQDLQQLHFESQWSQGARFFNEYGPTEATVWSSHYEIKADDSFQVAPIGRPAGHVNLYVMDHYGHLTPQGCEGELHIGGVGVARGYMDNAELTNGHFFSRQLYSGESERLYRTGDVVRYNKHGDIEFVGRKDNQVKIRGYRVELSEIEQQILHHPDVLDCVTKVWQEQGEEKLLIAYLQIRERQSEQAVVAAVKKQLAQTLPSYMQPNAITSIGHIPVNRNGKVDRKALPKPNLAALTGEYSPAQNSTQKKLLTIWAELLHLSAEEISINADFFELGGHSLLAVQLVTKVNETFPVDLSIKEIFSSPVLCDLADQVDALLHLDEDELAAAEAELADMSDEEIEKLYQELCDE